ncbi:single-stranded DNA binding protein [Halovenus marina]|uniref:single-stranded DNA binding protein n=1 Tax=Halovenus marina TaxID=3396621 RepID=UPI003F56F8D4
MGAIEDIYEDIDADVSEAEFREAVAEKVDQMDGLADEETAAMILAHELADGEVETISDIETEMDEVKFLAKVVSVGDLRTFERDDDEDGRVINVDVADETGQIRLAFWDERAVEVDDGGVEAGDVLRVKGRPTDGYSGLEVSVDKAEHDDADIDVDLGESTIESLTLGQSDVALVGLVLDTDSVRTFSRDDGSEGKVSNLALGDETGRVRVTLWDEQADQATELDPGETVEIVDGYVRERDGDLELHVGDRGAVRVVDETVEYDPETTPIGDVDIGETVDIAGVVRSTDPKRTFDRDDGSEGQVRNVRLQDDSGDIRVALWGEKADRDVTPGDEILITDAEIQDGWQDDLEASAGWQSAVTVLADGADPAEESTATASEESEPAVSDGGAGLDAFADGESPSESADDEVDADSGETVSFTGTVVQTGDPVVLDDGTETMTVETDARLQLGEEVTARGQLDGDRLDADELL